MPPEIKERVFEPFFTTKEKGKGTGLGLSTVYGIVKQSNGNIRVQSEPGKGTTFEIYFPWTDQPNQEFGKWDERGEIPYAKGTVLVVEDEEPVRKLAAGLLKKEGYKVLEAPHGGDASLICKRYKEPIDLILTDVVMPGMSGPELIDYIQQVRQDFKVLYMSAYADAVIAVHRVREGKINFIDKPFTLDGLSTKVQETLAKA